MLCPVCNGLQLLQESCPACNGEAVDFGRLSDLAGPYSPYGQIDEQLSHDDIQMHDSPICKHLIYCPSCTQKTEVSITEWR